MKFFNRQIVAFIFTFSNDEASLLVEETVCSAIVIFFCKILFSLFLPFSGLISAQQHKESPSINGKKVRFALNSRLFSEKYGQTPINFYLTLLEGSKYFCLPIVCVRGRKFWALRWSLRFGKRCDAAVV